jgi:dTDP-4-amino-4,6-dideoxygalactose transaminase
MIPFVDLKAQYQSIKQEIDSAIRGVLDSSQFVLGSEVAAFEQEFAAYCSSRYAVGVNSGTSALHLALLAAGVGSGDEVITVPFTFVATVAAIYFTGASPVFVDVEPGSLTMDVSQLEKVITKNTKVILPVHLYGHPADMDPVLEIARQHGLIVIEDAAQAHGAEYKGRRVGGMGDLGCFSFYPGKNLGAYGEGGMVVTNNPDYAQNIRVRRDWGQSSRYHHDLRGFNYRMEGLQGAILRVKLHHLDHWTEARRAHAARYTELLANTVVAPAATPFVRHVYHVYAIRTLHRDRVIEGLHSQGVQTGIHYPIPVHLQKAYSDERYQAGDFPCAELAAGEVLSLPIYPELSESQLETIAMSIQQSLATVKA